MALPLVGVRVIDLGHDWACPHTGRVLADFGAEVIKVEYPKRLDGMRGGDKAPAAYNGRARFFQLHRNKRSLALDLKRAEDYEAFAALVAVSDVLIANARTGVLDRLGFGRVALEALRPELVVLSMTAFGETGPDRDFAGYGGTIEAVSGIQALTGYGPDTPRRRIREMDVTNGILGACAVLTALLARQRTGRGAWIDFSELEAPTNGLIGEQLLELAVNGVAPEPAGNRHRTQAPHGCYPCREADTWVAIGVRSDAEWAALADVLGRREWAQDARFVTAADRLRNHDALDEAIGAWTRARTPDEAMAELQARGVPAGAVLDARALARDPHLAARGYFVDAEDGSGRFPGAPLRLNGERVAVRWRGPDLGADDERIRVGLLGRPASEIEPLTAERIGTAFELE